MKYPLRTGAVMKNIHLLKKGLSKNLEILLSFILLAKKQIVYSNEVNPSKYAVATLEGADNICL